ncbi:MAG: MerR family transcriptional regulator [Sphingomonadaceae bacterium]|nr:MerR family transcriptional regulator [Sphingomonadaceae bacterium]
MPFFDDGKSPDALRTIGEVAKALGIRQHVLRYWEEQFPTLKPLKRSGGRRYYRPEDVKLIARIDRLVHHDGYTLRGARQAISGKDRVETGKSDASAQAAPNPAEIRAKLVSIRESLAKALASA